MCGYAGIYSYRDRLPDNVNSLLCAAGDAIQHRGPDDSGVWTDKSVGVGLVHRRLAIQDLTASGSQPMSSPSGRYVMAFNGEIYNFQSLKHELLAKGFSFKGHSDTEVMLVTFEAWGVQKALDMFCGMFSFAVIDRKERRLILARDRMGEKPLYYGWVGNHFIFASELKALEVFPFWSGEINRDALTLLLRHNYIPSPHSIYKNIKKLLPATYIQIDLVDGNAGSQPIPESYWRLEKFYGASEARVTTRPSAADRLDILLREVIGEQLISDVPLGAFLSGGVDSSAIVAIMQQISSSRVKTFSIGFDEQEYNEAEYAKAVAVHLGTEHTELYITARDSLDVIPKLPILYDEPFADSSQIPTYLVAEMTRREVTVALSGDGGDELFCGYDRYFSTARAWDRQPRVKNKVIDNVLGYGTECFPFGMSGLVKLFVPSQRHLSLDEITEKLYRKYILAKTNTLTDFYRENISYWVEPEQLVIGSKEPDYSMNEDAPISLHDNQLKQLMWHDLRCYLPDDILVKVDRAAMACSLETRIPLLDRRIVEFSLQLPINLNVEGGTGKQVLRDVLYRYVPRALIEREKQGFAVPVGKWMRAELREWADSLLDESRLREEGFWHAGLVRRKWQDHCAGRGDHSFSLWGVLMFQAWKENADRKRLE